VQNSNNGKNSKNDDVNEKHGSRAVLPNLPQHRICRYRKEMLMNTLDPTLAMMLAVARRIACTNRTDPQQAKAEFKAHTSAMSPGEIKIFTEMYLDCLMAAA
jgi:hypothetical protein